MIISPASGQIKVKTNSGPPWRYWVCCMWGITGPLEPKCCKINLNHARKPTWIVDEDCTDLRPVEFGVC